MHYFSPPTPINSEFLEVGPTHECFKFFLGNYDAESVLVTSNLRQKYFLGMKKFTIL